MLVSITPQIHVLGSNNSSRFPFDVSCNTFYNDYEREAF